VEQVQSSSKVQIMTNIHQEIDALLQGTEKQFVYMDHAATTYTDCRVVEAMMPYFEEKFGNPGGFYEVGKIAADAVENARGIVAGVLNCSAEEVIFTSGGTESDNLAIFGVARRYADKGKHVITSVIEHHAVEAPCKQLEKEGFEVTVLPVDEFGRVSLEDVQAALRDDTILVSVMMANNEIGTLQPIAEIGALLKDHQAVFHTDACQAAGASALDVNALGVDLMTINGSKIYGPKGVGALYRRKGVRLKPMMYGGYQERGIRPGTENVPGIIGFAKALEIAEGGREAEAERLTELRDYMIAEIQKEIPKTKLNGHPTDRLPNNVNITFMDIEGESLLLFLNELGICAATGSACSSESLDPSHVIVATGVPYECAHGSIRFSLGRKTSRADIDYVLNVLPKIVEILRKISPLNMDVETLESNLDSPL
jgi:cysteine desulfurase